MTARTAVRENPAVLVAQPLRIRRDRKADTAAAGSQRGRDVSQFIRYGIDLMHKSIRCARCDMAVPLEFGDVSGKDMWDWMEAARIAVALQEHDAHEPVLVGARTGSQPPSASGEGDEAATRERDAQGRTEPPAPVPAEEGFGLPCDPAAPVLVAANSTPATTVAHLCESIPGVVTASEIPGPAAVFRAGPEIDCLHENFRGVKGVCPDCRQWVKP